MAERAKTEATETQNDLKAAGINMVIDEIPSKAYFTVARGDAAPDMGWSGWCWDWPAVEYGSTDPRWQLC
jgi:hypothetical protein